MEQENEVSLSWLDSDSKLATVWTAYLEPKTQQEAFRLINLVPNGEERRPRLVGPMQWVIDARETLQEKGCLIKTDNKLRNSIYKADITPVINTILNNRMLQYLFEIGYYSDNIRYCAKLTPGYTQKGKSSHTESSLIYELESGQNSDEQFLSELICEKNFDSFIEKNKNSIPPHFIERYKHCINELGHYRGSYCEQLFNHLFTSCAGVLIPDGIAHLFRAIKCNSHYHQVDLGWVYKRFMC